MIKLNTKDLTRLFALVPIAAKRGLVDWQTRIPLTIGLVLASVTMASTTIYYDSVSNLAFRHELTKHEGGELDILAVYSDHPTSRREYETVTRVADRQFDLRLSGILSGRVRATKTSTLALAATGNEDAAGTDDQRIYFATTPRLYEYAEILPGGSRPRFPELPGENEHLVIDGLVPVSVAEAFGIGIGDTFSAVPYGESDIPFARVNITGLLAPRANGTIFWQLYDHVLQTGTYLTVATVPVFVEEDTYFEILGPAFGHLNSTYGWLLDVDPQRIPVNNKDRIAREIELTQEWINSAVGDYQLSTHLLSIFDRYDERLLFTKIPMLVFLVLTAIVVLYYVGTLSSLIIDRQRGEIVLLRSRGATSQDALVVFAIEGAIMAFIATLLGPFIAATGIGFLGTTPAFSDLSGGDFLKTNITLVAYTLSGMGGILGLIAIIIGSRQALRASITGQRQQISRPPTLPAFQRRYLDVMLLVVVVVLFRQLSEQGSILATGMFGDKTINYVLLATPALGLVAVGMVLLRLFPLTMGIISRLLSRYSSAGLALGLWQISRNPTQYARISLLLILMAGLGVVAASFVATLERNFEERLLYSIGSDIRIEGLKVDTNIPRSDTKWSYEQVPGVNQATSVYRGQGRDTTMPQRGLITLLAVEHDNFSDVAWIRDDFSDKPMDEMLRTLRLETLFGIPLPESAASLDVRFMAERPDPSLRLMARIRDSNNRYHSYTLGPLARMDFLDNVDGPEWLLGSTSFFNPGKWWKEPLTLISIGIHADSHANPMQRGSILIDHISSGRLDVFKSDQGFKDIRVLTEVIEPFNDLNRWSVMRLNPGTRNDQLSGSGEIRFSWGGTDAMVSHGMLPGETVPPIPVLASDGLLKSGGYRLGERFDITIAGRTVPLELVDSVAMFPTLNPRTDRFVVADLGAFVHYTNLDPLEDELQANEVWLSVDPDHQNRTGLGARLYERPFKVDLVQELDNLTGESDVDPLAEAGWRALLLGAFVTVLLLSCLGFLIHVYFSFREREHQFAILRSIGLSMRQLLAIVWLEQAVLVLGGMSLGTWIGTKMVGTILPFMGHDDLGYQLLPPFVVQVDWSSLALAYALIAAVFGMIIVGMVWLVYRISIHRALRIEGL